MVEVPAHDSAGKKRERERKRNCSPLVSSDRRVKDKKNRENSAKVDFKFYTDFIHSISVV